ncbi:MAG: PAS domain S-box protein [Bacteroidales bacterium]|jgi:PAS domain S-box-containing protein|nr:PAS domain S-box protein [Bacteroidales bacterium]
MAKHYKILIVEDNPLDIELAQREIKHELESVEFSDVSTNEALIESLNTYKPDVIVSDFNMPNFDGLTVIRHAKKLAPLVPVIIYTGSIDEETAAETVKVGAVDYVLKENTIRLRQAINHALEIKQMWHEQIEAEEKLRASEEKYRLLFEQAADGIFQLNTEGNIIGSNSSGTEMTGYSKDELLTKNISDLYEKEDLKKNPIRYDLLQKGKVIIKERKIIKKNGSICEVEMHSKIMPNKTIQTIFRDITKRKQAEKELKESEERYSNLIRLLPVGVVINSKGNIVFANEAASKIMEASIEKTMGLNIFNFIHPDYQEVAAQRIKKVLNKNTKAESLEEVFITNKGNNISVEVTSLGMVYKGEPAMLTVFNDITARKQAELLLKESEAKYRTFFENTGTATIIIEEDKTISLVNSKFSELSGIPKEKIENKKKWTEFVVTEDLERMVEMHKLRRADTLKALKSYEFRFKDIKGNIKNILLYIDMIPGTHKSLASLLDITDRKKAEEEVSKSRILLRSMIDSLPMWISALDKDGNYFFANKHYEKTFMVPLHLIENHNFKDFFPPDLYERHKLLFDKCVNSAKTVEVIDDIEFEKGKKANVYGSYIPLFDSAGKVFGLSCAIMDFTRQKEAEQGLKEAKEQLQIIFDKGPDAILVTRIEDGYYIDSNDTFTKYTGYAPEDLKGKSTLDINIWDNPKDRDKLLHDVKTYGHCHNLEIIVQNKNGTKRIIDMSAELILIKGKPHLLSISRDISERKSMENLLKVRNEELKNLVATKDRFFSIIAHDLKDPLNAILGFSGILTENYKSLAEQDKINYINNIQLSTESLLKLIQNLLEWANSQTGKMGFKPEMLDVGHVVFEAIDVLQYRAKIKQIKIISDIPENLAIYADSNMVKTIIRNLVSNSIKYTNRSGFVRVSASGVSENTQMSDFVEISVSDNGVGIKKEHIDKIFKIDEKIKTPGTESETGSGLGLILCKELVEKNNGYLRIDSKENTGSTFIIGLPNKMK